MQRKLFLGIHNGILQHKCEYLLIQNLHDEISDIPGNPLAVQIITSSFPQIYQISGVKFPREPYDQLDFCYWLADAVRRDNLISIKLLMSTYFRSSISQSSSYPIVLTRLDGSFSRPKAHLKLWKCRDLTDGWDSRPIYCWPIVFFN